MNRRTFLGNAAIFGGAASSLPLDAAPPADAAEGAPAILVSWSNEDQRRRLENLRIANRSIRAALRKHLVTNYIPGHAIYNLDPATWDFTETDSQELAKLRDTGVGIIQPWSGWGSAWSGNAIMARNPEAFRRFVDTIHRLGMKVLPYTSSCFFLRSAPELKAEWAAPDSYDLQESRRWAHCSPASPGWRAFTLRRLVHVMDNYGVDGLYDDLGYLRYGERPNYYSPDPRPFAEDDVMAFPEGPHRDGALEDWLGLLYSEVKRRGCIYKLHKEGTDHVYATFRVYDYLWVGEATRDIDWMRNTVKNYDPYLIPQPLVTLGPAVEVESFLHAIPYLQFPILGSGEGRQFRGDFPKAFADWLKVYRPMVEDGTWVWMEVSDSDLFPGPLAQDTVASVFVNREFYLVLANYRHGAVEVETTDAYTSVLQPPEPRKRWSLAPRSLQILRRAPLAGHAAYRIRASEIDPGQPPAA
jgi:hypothetical protein